MTARAGGLDDRKGWMTASVSQCCGAGFRLRHHRFASTRTCQTCQCPTPSDMPMSDPLIRLLFCAYVLVVTARAILTVNCSTWNICPTRLVGWSAGRLVGCSTWNICPTRWRAGWPVGRGGDRRLCGAEGGGGGGWGSISARVPYLGIPLTHSVINQRTVSPISPPHTTNSPRLRIPT